MSLALTLLSCKKSVEKTSIEDWRSYRNKNFFEYRDIYKQANDSLTKWINDSSSISQFYTLYPYELDSTFIFNKNKDRFYTVILGKGNIKADALDLFGGTKINGHWYFFIMGMYGYVSREVWQDSLCTQLTFEELSYVAYETHFKNLVKNMNEGHLERNEEIFDKQIFTEFQECKKLNGINRDACEDSMILNSVKGKYKYKLDTKEILDIKKNISENKISTGVSLVNRRNWWDKLMYGEKVFESEEWKNRSNLH